MIEWVRLYRTYIDPLEIIVQAAEVHGHMRYRLLVNKHVEWDMDEHYVEAMVWQAIDNSSNTRTNAAASANADVPF